MKPLLDLGAGPIERGGRGTILDQRSIGIARRRRATLILGESIEAGLLFVRERTVELVERGLDDIDRLLHRLDALLHRRESAGCRRCNLGRTGCADQLCRLDRGIAEFVEACVLRVRRLHRGCDLINRQADNVAAIASAELIKRNAARPPLRMLRQIGRKPIVPVWTEDAGIDVRIAVAPEAGTVAPDRVIVQIVIRERPEQRTDPAIAATRTLPASA